MKAIILLGGLGTRLRPFTLDTPKPLLPVINRPFFAYQLDQLKKHGVRDVVLALGYRAAHFRRRLGSGRRWGVRFTYSLETTPLGTGGAIRKAAPHTSGPTFVLNGDILNDLDLGRLHRFHRRTKSQATLALVKVEDPSLYGLIETDTQGRIRRFVEKPTATESTTNTINAGTYLFEPAIFRQIPSDRPVSIERDVFPKLVNAGFALYGFRHRGYWIDMGTLRSYWKVHMDLLSDHVVTRTAGLREIRRGIWAGPACRIGGSARARGTAVLGSGCRIGPRVVLQGNVSLGPGCVVAEGAHLSDCVIHEGAVIGENARVDKSVIGRRCRIGAESRVGPFAAVAGGSVLGTCSQVAHESWGDARA